MSTSAHLVLENFYWRLLGLTPAASATQATPAARFFECDPVLEGVAGKVRGVVVTWLGSDEEHNVDGEPLVDPLTDRTATHRFRVEIYYSRMLRHRALQQLILQDRHDVTKDLRAEASQVGYDDSHTATNLGLYYRIREADELDESDPEHLTWRSIWRCVIQETE